ncbi:Hypothetical predicted protein [Pelobates cultripes]|nr:Hypothetical predicted protein [Pelobates cultripes]
MSSSKSHHTPKTSSFGHSLFGIRSPLASFFSFRKSSKQNAKPHTQQDRHGTGYGTNQTPVNTEGRRKFEMYQSSRSVKQIAKLFEPPEVRTRENDRGLSRVQLEKEAIQVLGDLDQKLAQEQKQQDPAVRPSTGYRTRCDSSSDILSSNLPEDGKEYNRTYQRDGTRTVSLEEGHTSRATFQPKNFYDMYSNRQRTVTNQPSEKSPSVCSAVSNKSPSCASNSGSFSSSSLQSTNVGQPSFLLDRTRQHKSRRIPVTSIKWGQPSVPGKSEDNDKLSRAQPSIDLSSLSKTHPENRIYVLYRDKTSQQELESNAKPLAQISSANNMKTQVLHSVSDKSTSTIPKAVSQNLTLLSTIPIRKEIVREEENKENSFSSSELKCKPVVAFSTVESDKEVEPMETDCDNDRQGYFFNRLVTPNVQESENATDNKNSDNMNVAHNITSSTYLKKAELNAGDGARININNQTLQRSANTAKDQHEHEPLKILSSNLPKHETTNIDVPSSCDPPNYVPDKMEVCHLTENVCKTIPHLKGSNIRSIKEDSLITRIGTYNSQSINIIPNPKISSTQAFIRTPALTTNTLQVSESNCLQMVHNKGTTYDNNCHSSDFPHSWKRYTPSLPDVSKWSYLPRVSQPKIEIKKGNLLSAVSQESKPDSTCVTSNKECSTTQDHLLNISSQPVMIKMSDQIPDKSPDLHKALNEISKRKKEYNDLLEQDILVSQRRSIADSNNNKQSIEVIQTSDNIIKNDARTPNIITAISDTVNNCNQQTENTTSTKLKLLKPYLKNGTMTSQQTNEKENLEKHKAQSSMNINQALIHNVHTIKSNKTTESVDSGNSTFPVRKIIEERLQVFSSSRAPSPSNSQTKSATTNLLKEHLLLAPTPFKVNASVKEYTAVLDFPPEINPQNTDGPALTVSDLHIGENATRENLASPEMYAVTRITENTQIYETVNENSVIPDSTEIGYHKQVSIYYSLPRKHSKSLLGSSRNQMKNIDNTLEINNAPSVLLEKVVNRHDFSESQVKSEYQNIGKPKPHYTTEHLPGEELMSTSTKQSKSSYTAFPVIPLQTSLLKNKERLSSDQENLSPNYDILDRFGGLQISERDTDHYRNNSPPVYWETQKSCINKNDYMDFEYSGMNTSNFYTLPNKRTRVKSLEKKRVSTAHDNITAQHTYRSSKSLTSSPEFANSNLSYSVSPNFFYPDYSDSEEIRRNKTNLMMTGDRLFKERTTDEDLMTRKQYASVYRSKSLKDLKGPEFYVQTPHHYMGSGNMPGSEWNSRPPLSSQSNITKVDKSLNQRRPSYCSQFVQNQMKSAKVAKKFTFSFDNLDQQGHGSPPYIESFDNSTRMSEDLDSPFVMYTSNDNYKAHLNKHAPWGKSPSERAMVKVGKHSNLYRSKSMRTLSMEEKNLKDSRRTNNQQFSSNSYGENLNRSPIYANSSHRRYSAELIIDENDNWPSTDTSHIKKPVYTSKSLDYGIFGKEQQAILLNNVKRSLTEGRLWRPCHLKNPGFLRGDEQFRSCKSPESPLQTFSPESYLNIYEDNIPVCSDSDYDTTTDDEYYLDGHDKESEL